MNISENKKSTLSDNINFLVPKTQKALLIAEKPSEMRNIKEVYEKHKSEIPYEITFLAQRGHLMTLKLPNELDEEQSEWAWETLPFHPEDHGGWQYKIIEEKKEGKFLTSKERLDAIRTELKSGDYDFIINAGDPDQEGELLVRIVLAHLKPSIPVKRYWSNDTTEGKVLDALKNLLDDDHDPMLVNLLAAAYGRQHSDYRFGMNISRAASLKMGVMAACGRVKTPILAIVCKREEEIKDFKPTTKYGVMAMYDEGFSGQLYNAAEEAEGSDEEDEKDEAAKGLVWFDTEDEAQECIEELGRRATVVKSERKRVETFAPKLYKLATAQVAAGKLGMTSSETLETIQSLYEKGYVSYPRTDCEYLSSHEDFDAMLDAAASCTPIKSYVESIDRSVIAKVKKTKKWVNDDKLKESGHSALAPTTKAPNFATLTPYEQTIYTLISRQFAAIFMPPLVQEKTLVVTEISGKSFKSVGKTTIDAGYAKMLGTKFTDMEIPVHDEDDVIGVEDFEVSSKTSTCPKRFTDGDLIAVCEAPHKYLDDPSLKALGKRLSIGTPATRASIIKELIDKNKYLERHKEGKTGKDGKKKEKEYIIPSETGQQIYDNLKDLDICKVDLTGIWEEKLEKVRKGEMTLAELEEGMREHVNALVENIKNNSDITKVFTTKKTVCKCPSCDGDIIIGSKGFYCSNYKDGCKEGAFRKICDTTIKPELFARMIAGDTVKTKLSKNGREWEQELRYNSQEHRIEFVQSSKPEIKNIDHSCPKCGGELINDGRKLRCANECGFTFWLTQFGKALTNEQIESFFEKGTTGVVEGLTGKSGKTFSAEIVLKQDKTGTELKFK